ncbi:hypothetical protein E2C01_058693 [Portunus trituberculatus]|uniref:Uncharacterized protein n=1 Tax=Portunus trituberculatus TaxID=210409 RepID=A0A5B7H4V0_PORTR|nr:hypothetical protein [Portunus trituberculatus]
MRGYFLGYLLSQSPAARKPLTRVRKPILHSDRGQDSNSCAFRPLGPQSTRGSTAPRRPLSLLCHSFVRPSSTSVAL